MAKKASGGRLRGHAIYRILPEGTRFTHDRKYFYKDDNTPVDFDNHRDCIKCGLPPTEDGHDPCIANLPNTEFACCGHGSEFSAYIKFNAKAESIRGKEALDMMEKLKKSRDDN